ncbi:MAG TPA: penicillin acylase family protein [Steroidobacteraceae bacterium]|nr:penicillin acylase family protein [Steroidobacteraceae bacterium]
MALLALVWIVPCPADTTSAEAQWRVRAARVTIARDDWGIAHVRGETDADAVFGMMYAQAEDDFNRIETNYLVSLGRLAEAEGENALWQDLRQRLFIDPETLESAYAGSPPWLRALMRAWADGLNMYLAVHPEVHPRVLKHFEPWMALSFTEGSIGGDIERVPLERLRAFYDKGSHTNKSHTDQTPVPAARYRDPQGSNGFAIAPSHTLHHLALLLINPHTSFFFRSELQVASRQGLDVYGAVTWGQFFVYQGFNAHAGWMHTSSGVDNVDEFAETIVTSRDGSLGYRYGERLLPIKAKTLTLFYRMRNGAMAAREFKTYASHHGPIVGEEGGKWIAEAMMNRPVAALEQSFLRTKAHDYHGFLKVAQLQANSSNNTIFADAKGEIAYLHPQFVPVRSARFDYRKAVDGSDPTTDWRGLHSLDSLPHVLNPPNGWVMNTNDWPWTAAGANSPKATDFPPYMDQVGENPRGPHAVRVLSARQDFTPESLTAAAFDTYQPVFAQLVPQLLDAYDRLATGAPQRAALAAPIALLRGWDFRWGLDSAPTSLAVVWGETLWSQSEGAAEKVRLTVWDYLAARTSDAQKLAALATAARRLEHDFGRLSVRWGEINRLQRNDGAIVQTFSDARPSIAVPFTSSRWGSFASFRAKPYPGTRRYYGTYGNSFVAVVEFGPRVRAWGVDCGGESSSPTSRHFFDQAQRYAEGRLRPIYFYPGDLAGHLEKSYRPGDPISMDSRR